MDPNDIFFELIQVSIGTRKSLPHTPTVNEWGQLYEIALKQSMVGICFAGLQKMGANADDGYCRIGMSEMQYLIWNGMAAKIYQWNDVVNRQCIELQKRLSTDGFRSSILKGQGVAQMYGSDLSMLRQSGDIDVWIDAPKEKVVAWAEKEGITEPAGYLHVGVRCFEDTEVELHFRPTYVRCLKYNRRLQAFCEKHRCDWKEVNGLVVPSWEFNVIYLLSHIYRHLFGLGIGLRQLMDYYWILKNNPSLLHSGVTLSHSETIDTLKYLGLYRFAGAVMYVMREVFLMDEQYMICPVDEKRGRMLLEMVMQTGSFGRMDMKQQNARRSKVGSLGYKVSQWWKLVRLYPEETLSAPFFILFR